MAVVILVVDDAGTLVRVEKRQEETVIGKIREADKANKVVTAPLILPFVPAPEVYTFREIQDAIIFSPKLSNEQRREAQAIFDSFVPGDRFQVVRERPITQQGKDDPGKPKPLFTVFIDP